MLKTHFDPGVGLPARWLIPGGGLDEGENTLEAAIRELAEETGLIANPKDLGDPVLVASGTWVWADGIRFHTYTDTIYELEVEKFEINTQGFTSDEIRDVLEYKWWNLGQLLASDELIGPHELKDYLRSRFDK